MLPVAVARSSSDGVVICMIRISGFVADVIFARKLIGCLTSPTSCLHVMSMRIIYYSDKKMTCAESNPTCGNTGADPAVYDCLAKLAVCCIRHVSTARYPCYPCSGDCLDRVLMSNLSAQKPVISTTNQSYIMFENHAVSPEN